MAQMFGDADALATLISGILTAIVGLGAIGGAIVVGLKQTGITDRQADIADRQTAILQAQVELEAQKVAHDLYERRYRAFDVSAILINEAIRGVDEEMPAQIRDDFLIALSESRFLFPEDVHQALLEIWTKTNRAFFLTRKMKMDYFADQEYAEGDSEEQLEINLWFIERMRTLHEAFPQLRLG